MDLLCDHFAGCGTVGHVVYPTVTGHLSKSGFIYHASGWNHSASTAISTPTLDDHYVQAEWSPDGKYIYYAHYNSNDPPDAQLNPAYDIFRMSYPDGQPEKIADHAFWPNILGLNQACVRLHRSRDWKQ